VEARAGGGNFVRTLAGRESVDFALRTSPSNDCKEDGGGC